MADMVSVPVVKPSDFLTMKQQAKAALTQDMNLDKAAELTAQRNALLLNKDVPDALKRAQLKELNRKVAHWTKKVREPFGMTSDAGEVGPTETDVSPTQNMIKALIKTIKSPEVDPPPIPRAKRRPVDDLTPVPTPPTRPAKKKGKKALGVETPLSAPLTPPTRPKKKGQPSTSSTPASAPELTEDRQSSVAKGKQIARKYLKKKGKELAKKAAKDVTKRWLDF